MFELTIMILLPLLFLAACLGLRSHPQFNLHVIPLGCLLVLLTASVFGHEFFHASFGPIPVTIDRVLLGLTASWFGWQLITRRESLPRWNSLDLAIAVWLAVITISTLTHPFTIRDNLPASRLLFFNLLPVMLYGVIRCCHIRPPDLKMISLAFALLGIYLAWTAIAEVKQWSSLVLPGYILSSSFDEFLGRGRGPFLNPVANGVFLTIGLCSLLMWWPRINHHGKGLIVGLTALISVGVYATLTRSVWLAMLVGCGSFVWIPANRSVKSRLLLAAILAGVIGAPLVAEKVTSFKRDVHVSVEDMERSASLRPLFALVAWEMVQDRPIAGFGFGQYSVAKYPYLKDPHTDQPLRATRLFMQHNVFLAYLTELGLIGILALVWMLSQMVRCSWQVWRNRSLDLWARQFGLIGIVMLICYGINGMFHDISIVPMQHMLLMFLMGINNNILTRAQPFLSQADADRPAINRIAAKTARAA